MQKEKLEEYHNVLHTTLSLLRQRKRLPRFAFNANLHEIEELIAKTINAPEEEPIKVPMPTKYDKFIRGSILVLIPLLIVGILIWIIEGAQR